MSSYARSGLTLEALAVAKGLPVRHLRARGWWTGPSRTGALVVHIPWTCRYPSGAICRAYHDRHRIPKEGGGPRWLWDLPHGAVLDVYGWERVSEWLAQAEAKGRAPGVVLCESEMDMEISRFHDVPALATGGAQFWKTAWAGTVLAFEKVYICQEPDDASRDGVVKVARDLLVEAERLGLHRDIRVVRFPAEVKDAGQLHLAVKGNRAAFRKALGGLIAQSVPAAEVVANAPVPVAPFRPRREYGVSQDAPPWVAVVFEAIVSFLDERGYGPRLKASGGVEARCPLHHDRHESLSVHPVRGWKCHGGCGQGKLTALAARLAIRLAEAVA